MKIVQDGNTGTYVHYCPGCKTTHRINTLTHNHCNAIWSLVKSDPDSPTFSPSINNSYNQQAYVDDPGLPAYRCHYFIVDGNIQYCSDTTNPEVSGKVVPLPDLPQSTIDFYSETK